MRVTGYRVQRLTARYGITEGEARRRITDSDEEKRQAIRHMHNNVEWKDLRHYHLAINTAVIPPAAAVEMIVLAVQAVDREQSS